MANIFQRLGISESLVSEELKQEIAHVIKTYSREEAGEFLKTIKANWSTEGNNVIFKSPGFANASQKVDLKIFNSFYKPEREKGKPCPKCKSDDTFAFLLQLRAADEAATVVTVCNSCNFKSKQ